MTSEEMNIEDNIFHLEADTPVLTQTEYKVKYTGDYKAFDLVEFYLERDITQFPIAAFPAFFVATGKHTMEELDGNNTSA